MACTSPGSAARDGISCRQRLGMRQGLITDKTRGIFCLKNQRFGGLGPANSVAAPAFKLFSSAHPNTGLSPSKAAIAAANFHCVQGIGGLFVGRPASDELLPGNFLQESAQF